MGTAWNWWKDWWRLRKMENGLRKGSIGKDEPFKEGEASFYITARNSLSLNFYYRDLMLHKLV
ncbi:hypothetical protein RUM44_006394 [Polyplax serrata]|uniref:Uncharacterized protein n=1 Tax=Polyplax serrata TaxID=468196 RepID=A0ABR1AHY8_POLSC